MKIQIINPLLGGDFSALDIAITALGTYINERSDHTATVLDFTFHRHEWKKHLQDGITREEPDIIGISVNNLYWGYARKIMDEIKKNHTIPIIVGGYHPSINAEAVFAQPQVDYLCQGDGEVPTVALLDALEKNESCEGIKGIWGKQGGKEFKNERGYFNEDIDSLPIPDWDLWDDLDKYFYHLNMMYVIGTRGCPFKCSYCSAADISAACEGKYYRVRSPEGFADELNYQWQKYKGKFTMFQVFDQIFTQDIEWIRRFTKRYRELGLHEEIKYSVFSRIDHLYKNVGGTNEPDVEKLDLLAAGGCKTMRVGVEAGNDHIRNEVYKKNLSKEDIRAVFKACFERDIDLTAFFIIGGPEENKKTLWDTWKFSTQLGSLRTAYFVYKPFEGSLGAEQAVEAGASFDQSEYMQETDNITFGAVLDYDDMSKTYVNAFQMFCYATVLSRRIPRLIWDEGLGYFFDGIKYMYHGMRAGLDWHYLMPYYHIYHGRNILK